MKESASCLCTEKIVGSKLEEINKKKGRNSITDACGGRTGKKERTEQQKLRTPSDKTGQSWEWLYNM